MGILQIIGAILTLAMGLFNLWREKDVVVKAIKKEAMKDAMDAIDAGDSAALGRAFERMHK